MCGEESYGSNYWLPMSQQVWDVIKKVIEPLYDQCPFGCGERHVTYGRFFFQGLEQPFCSPECGLKYRETENDL